jgi:hypothetical protein
MEEQQRRRHRGKGTKPALVHINLRLPEWVVEFYREQPNYTGTMREVLTIHAQEKQIKTDT